LAAATTVNGRHIAPGQIGLIAPAARADILLLPADPTRNLTALDHWTSVVADGRRYDRATVDGWIDVYRRYFHGWLYAHVMDGVADMAVSAYRHPSPAARGATTPAE
jgi:cytosine/adenosine deaminase-related metal-dependent hydrolase